MVYFYFASQGNMDVRFSRDFFRACGACISGMGNSKLLEGQFLELQYLAGLTIESKATKIKVFKKN